MEDDVILKKMEDDPHFFSQLKSTSIFSKIEDGLKLLGNGYNPNITPPPPDWLDINR